MSTDDPDAPEPATDDAPVGAKTEAAHDPARELDVRAFSVTVLSGPDAGARFASTGRTLTLGSHPSVGAVLDDPTVSRFHAEIDIDGGRARVRDLGSRNGTAVDGVAVVDAWLRDGSVIAMGHTTLRFDVGTSTIAVPTSPDDRFGLLLGRSVPMRRVFEVLKRAVKSDATVLLLGETGSGKEVVAESLHREGARHEGPFVVVDCGAIPAALLESELFGHERGAFTNAHAAREGVLEAAHGGTVFLDEIGELGADLQPKLLRALERREVRRVGSNHYIPIDVRVIAATHRDLRAEVNSRRFRADLYYRLAVVEVRLPPLRERREDIPLLVDHFLRGLVSGPLLEASPAATYVRSLAFAESLAEHAWAGNVRELRNYVERTLALYGLPEEGGDAATAPDGERTLREARDQCVRRFERAYLEAVMERHGQNVTAAARAAGVDRVHFYRLLWRHELR